MANKKSKWQMVNGKWKKSCLWEDGYYRMVGMSSMVFLVTGENVKMENLSGGAVDDSYALGTWKFGDFDEAHPEVAKHTGQKNNNVDISLWGGMLLSKGVLSDDGKAITIWSLANKLSGFEKMSGEDYATYLNSADPADAPSSHYKIQPEFQGKLLWVSGAPGLGKSTTGLFLSRTADYVYYEADAFGSHLNPYIPLDADEPSMATMKQKPLKGVPQDRLDAVKASSKDLIKFATGEDYNSENLEIFYSAMCKDIKTEKKRMGGNWVIAQAVPSKALRDHIKKQLGPELLFVVLNMKKEDQMKRIQARHGEEGKFTDMLTKLYDLYEPATEDEEQATNVFITSDMSKEDVVKKVLKTLQE